MPSVAFTASSASSFSRKTTNAKHGGDFATHISLRGPYLSKTCCNSRFDTPIPIKSRDVYHYKFKNKPVKPEESLNFIGVSCCGYNYIIIKYMST